LTNQFLAGHRILILEDEYLIAMDVEQLCRDHGADEAILRRDLAVPEDIEKFDVAVIDLMVSGQSTLDFARSLKARNIPFVFATGYAGSPEPFGDFPGVPVVGKPYAGSDIIEAIALALRGAGRSSDVGAENLGGD
jgi:CheY-like chemotaxis protein